MFWRPMAETWVEPNRTEQWRQTDSIWTGPQAWQSMKRRWTQLWLVCYTLIDEFISCRSVSAGDGRLESLDQPIVINSVCSKWKTCVISYTEFKVFNIVIFSLALCILTFTGLYYVTVCYNRTRWTSHLIVCLLVTTVNSDYCISTSRSSYAGIVFLDESYMV